MIGVHMTKKEYNFCKMEEEEVHYGKRYGYWWKKHKKIAAGIKNLRNGVDYFHSMEYKLDKPMSRKHFHRWRRHD